MIIQKKNQKVGKRNRSFDVNKNIGGSFKFSDFSRIRDFRNERKKKVFYFSSIIRDFFNLLGLICKSIINNIKFNNFNFNVRSFHNNFRNLTLRGFNNFELNFNTVFILDVIIFILVLVFYFNIFSYYGSFVFLNKIKFPKDYFIDTFIYYSDQNISGVNNDNYLLGPTDSNTIRQDKAPFLLKITEHKVNSGETLSHIAARYGITSETLISYNSIKDVRNIRPGLLIKVPNMKGVLYYVRKNDSLSSIANTYNVSKVDILDANDLENEVLKLNQKLFIPGGRLPKSVLQEALGEFFMFPVQGVITSGYGYRPDPFTGGFISFHNGIDIANAKNTPIRAAKAGIIVATTSNFGGYGKHIIISHGRGLQTLYGHMSSFVARIGQRVERGSIIGYIGSTGYSTGNHLHFTIFKNGKTVNPVKYLK